MWSARNVAHVARLEAAGRMHEAGRAQVRAAQADGRWERAYAGSASIEVPADLAAALAAEPRAQEMFDALTATNRFAVIYRATTVKRPETRERRIAEFVGMLARGETPYPQRRRPPGWDQPVAAGPPTGDHPLTVDAPPNADGPPNADDPPTTDAPPTADDR